jgi:hypothetical protein
MQFVSYTLLAIPFSDASEPCTDGISLHDGSDHVAEYARHYPSMIGIASTVVRFMHLLL